MKMENNIVFKFVKKDEKEQRDYRLELPHGAPLGECYEAIYSFMEQIIKQINDSAEKMRPQDAESVEDVQEAKSLEEDKEAK